MGRAVGCGVDLGSTVLRHGRTLAEVREQAGDEAGARAEREQAAGLHASEGNLVAAGNVA